MTHLLLIASVAAALTTPVSSIGADYALTTAPTRHCGSFKYGLDGQQPGPTDITAKNVSCWLARAVALLPGAPGWHCANTVGILFVCKRGDAVVTFNGE
jgi:hypothetical protein